MRKLLFFVILQAFALAEKVQFNGYRVYRVKTTENDIKTFEKLQTNENYTFWTEIRNSNGLVDIMVAPHEVENFAKEFPKADLQIKNVQKLIDNERPKIRNKAMTGSMTWDDYYTYDQINNWLEELTREFPDNVKLVNVGKSHEGRNILGVHLSYKPENKDKAILLEGGIHAREWISVATVTYQLNELLRSEDPEIRQLAQSHDWYFFPIYNPDGYVYTHTRNRMWRKTRKRYGLCYGADPNRNWGFKWHEGDYNYINPCSDTYAGPSAFSEPETRQLSEFIKTIGSDLIGYISHHAYSQVILLPYGDSAEHRDNFDELYSVGLKMAENIQKVNGTEYKVGNIVEVLYKATGNDVDWVKNELKTRMTFIYELRDTGKYGFLLPANQIIPSGIETMVGLVTMLKEFQIIDQNKNV